MLDRLSRPLLLALCAFAVPACTAGDATNDEQDLTSLTARERKLTFEGFVYVDASASDRTILEAVRHETKSAFGALRIANISVGSRELTDVDAKSFSRETVTMVDPKSGKTTKMLKVSYRYIDEAIIPKTMTKKSAVHLGLLHGDYDAQSKRILKECTEGSEEDIEFESDIWYVFNPSLDSCQAAIKAEQAAIDADRANLSDPKTQIVPSERTRLYLPMTARLEAKAMTAGTVYPEYDRLFSGGVEPGTLIIDLVNGVISHGDPGPANPLEADEGYVEMLGEMEAILAAEPALTVVATEPVTDLSTFTIEGKKVTGATFKDFIQWGLHDKGFPTGFTTSQRKSLKKAVAERLFKRWVTFEEPLQVTIGSAAPKTVKARINQYFGAGEDDAPYRRAVKTSDVFVFNGHSFIGSGPLDPGNFTESDLAPSYQIFFIDSCVSYNYYNKEFFDLKAHGTKDLDTITNGVESFSDGSGAGEGRFVAALLSGKQPSYKKLLQEASTTGTDYDWGKDALRVVDGEGDNAYSPKTTPISIK